MTLILKMVDMLRKKLSLKAERSRNYSYFGTLDKNQLIFALPNFSHIASHHIPEQPNEIYKHYATAFWDDDRQIDPEDMLH